MGRATSHPHFKFSYFIISIHALRGEGDCKLALTCGQCGISIHALRGEGDPSIDVLLVGRSISIHALRGEGDLTLITAERDELAISIHALRGEGDERERHNLMIARRFQSTPSVGRATERHSRKNQVKDRNFNPRPPWGGRPRRSCASRPPKRYFNPRPPWGGRLSGQTVIFFIREFQSTPSVGRATFLRLVGIIICAISIHALRGEGDCLCP